MAGFIRVAVAIGLSLAALARVELARAEALPELRFDARDPHELPLDAVEPRPEHGGAGLDFGGRAELSVLGLSTDLEVPDAFTLFSPRTWTTGLFAKPRLGPGTARAGVHWVELASPEIELGYELGNVDVAFKASDVAAGAILKLSID